MAFRAKRLVITGRLRGKQVGAAAYLLSKPLESEILVNTIKEVLATRER